MEWNQLIITVLASGTTAALASHWLNSKFQERVILRNKLEELYLALHKFSMSNKVRVSAMKEAMIGRIAPSEVWELMNEYSDNDYAESLPVIERVVGIYFQDLRELWLELSESRRRLNSMEHSFLRPMQPGPTSRGQRVEIDDYNEECKRYDRLTEALTQRIVSHRITRR